MQSLKNEVVMISGGSKGIGLAVAENLGKQGAKVSISARGEKTLQLAEERLRLHGVDAFAVQADVSSEADVDRWFSETERRFGSPGILVNNAGVSGYGDLLDLKEDEWDKTVAINCRGPFLCTRRALPGMIEKKRGKIFMISSIASKYYRRGHSLYFATKWALNGFAHCVAKEVQEQNVHVYIVCPGMTETNFFDSAGKRPHPDDYAYIEPEWIANLIDYMNKLPVEFDTQEWMLFPSWQLHRFGIRR